MHYSGYNKDICSPMFIAALFTIATVKNESLLFLGKWMELENIILNEASQAQKAKSHVFSLIRIL
jgi:hypothetical protein